MDATTRTPPHPLRITLAVFATLVILDIAFFVVRDRSLTDLAIDLSTKLAGFALFVGVVWAAERNRRRRHT